MTLTRRSATGFTLIELMIVVAIVGILAAIAYPSYREHILRTNRGEVKALMQETAQFMERWFTSNNGSYVGAALPSAVSPRGATGSGVMYKLDFWAGPTATAYTLRARPANTQLADACGILTLEHTGAKSPTTGRCW